MFFRLVLIFLFYFSLAGMSIVLKDGNYVDVSNYYFYNGKIIFKVDNKIYELDERFVNKKATTELNYLENKKISIFKSHTSYIERIQNKSRIEVEKKIKPKSKYHNPEIKIETRKEKNPFFNDEPVKDENFIEKIQRKGIMIKIQVPVIEEKK